MKKLALYIHVPFCVQKCLYCDFLSMPASQAVQQQYVSVLLQELSYWQQKTADAYRLETVFLGGGTPTVLQPALLYQIGEAVRQFSMADSVEYTIEANPGTLTAEQVSVMRQMGVNRVSLGLQSAQPGELQALGRIHTYEDFIHSYDLLRKSGFSNINVDLMADIPEQTMDSYADTLDRILQLSPEHISAYSLIVEEGTPYYEMQEQGKLQIPPEETDRQMYAWTKERLADGGYERYEISNYARVGYVCRHNLVYWQMEEYLGVGLGAASYVGGNRFSNERDLSSYLSQAADAHITASHLVTPKEEKEEYVFLGLRKTQGIHLKQYRNRFGADFRTTYRKILPRLLEQGLLAESENHDRIYLTEYGMDVSNVVLAEFLL